MADDHHDHPPEPRRVDDAAALGDRALDVGSDLVGRRPEWATLLDAGGHRRVDEAGLDADDAHRGAGMLVRQPFEEAVEAGLGRTVEEIAAASAVAGDRADADQ